MQICNFKCSDFLGNFNYHASRCHVEPKNHVTGIDIDRPPILLFERNCTITEAMQDKLEKWLW